MIAAPMGGQRGKDVRAMWAFTPAGWVGDVAVHLSCADRATFEPFIDPAADDLFARVEQHLTRYRVLAMSGPKAATIRQALRDVREATCTLQATVNRTAPVLADVWDADVLNGDWPALHVATLQHTLDQLEDHVHVRLAWHEAADRSGRPPNPPVAWLAGELAQAYRVELELDGVPEADVSADSVEAFVAHAIAFVGLKLTKRLRAHLRSQKPTPTTG